MTPNTAVEADINEAVGRLVTIDDIRKAQERIGQLVRRTPFTTADALSRLTGHEVMLKHEYMQRTGSYKVRGAFNCISQLPEGKGVVAASAGNHAQGVALAAQLTGRQATIYMPASAPLPKREATRSYGAEVILVEGGVEECLAAAWRHSNEQGAAFIPPFDHLDVIAGQGTVGLELAEELPSNTDTVLVPVGGGGLISGVSVALKTLRPEIKIIGVEPEGASAMKDSLAAHECITLDGLSTMADGIAVRRVCDLTLAHAEKYVDDVVLVSEEAISRAVLILLDRAKAVVEPAGAVGMAALMTGRVAVNGPVCSILSGGNIDPVLLSKVMDYGLTNAGRYLRLRVVLDDRPGLLTELAKTLSDMDLNVVLIENHRAGAAGLLFNEVEVMLTLETRDPEQHEQITAEISARGFPVELMK
jgi:threonine dehydratase